MLHAAAVERAVKHESDSAPPSVLICEQPGNASTRSKNACEQPGNACRQPGNACKRSRGAFAQLGDACGCACRFLSGMTYMFSVALLLTPIWFTALMLLLRYQDGRGSEADWHVSLAMFGIVAAITVIVGVLCGLWVSLLGARDPCCDGENDDGP